MPIPEPDLPDNRINDGSCDRIGRFWAGTQHLTIREPRGSLYRLDPDHTVRKMLHGITVSNMVRFSPDDRTLYYADTYSDVMYALDFSLADGTIAEPPRVRRHDKPSRPSGRIGDRRRRLPVERGIRRLARRALHAAGPDRPRHRISGDAADLVLLRRLEASIRSMSPARRSGSSRTSSRRQPLAGGLFAVHVGVTGLPEAEYAG